MTSTPDVPRCAQLAKLETTLTTWTIMPMPCKLLNKRTNYYPQGMTMQPPELSTVE